MELEIENHVSMLNKSFRIEILLIDKKSKLDEATAKKMIK